MGSAGPPASDIVRGGEIGGRKGATRPLGRARASGLKGRSWARLGCCAGWAKRRGERAGMLFYWVGLGVNTRDWARQWGRLRLLRKSGPQGAVLDRLRG